MIFKSSHTEILIEAKLFLTYSLFLQQSNISVFTWKSCSIPPAPPTRKYPSLTTNHTACSETTELNENLRSGQRERERDPPINYSLGISHVPFICLHLTNRHSGSQKSRKHGSHNPKKSSKTDEEGGGAKRGKRARGESESRHCHKGENVCGKPTGCGWHEVH